MKFSFRIEDISSLAKALQIKEITIDGNPITLNADYISFLVSYLPNLQLLSTMQISEQIRRTAMAWRFSKEQSNSAFLDLSTQVCVNVRREEVISNAKVNWELLRARNKISIENCNKMGSNKKSNNINVLHIQSPNKFNAVNSKNLDKTKTKGFGSLTSINENVEAKKIHIKKRSCSSDNLFKLENTSKSYPLEFKLPPILGSIVDSLTSDKFKERLSKDGKENIGKTKMLSDIENSSDSELDSLESHESLKSGLRCHMFTPNSCGSSTDYDKCNTCKKFTTVAKDACPITTGNFHGKHDNEHDKLVHGTTQNSLKYCDLINENEAKSLNNRLLQSVKIFPDQDGQSDCQSETNISSEYYFSCSKTSNLDSCKSTLSDSSTSLASIPKNVVPKSHDHDKDKSRIKSAQVKKVVYYKSNRAATARAKFRALAPSNPPPRQVAPKEREQGRLINFSFF